MTKWKGHFDNPSVTQSKNILNNTEYFDNETIQNAKDKLEEEIEYLTKLLDKE